MLNNNEPLRTNTREQKYKVLLKEINFIDLSGWDMTLIEMWNNNYSRNEIARRVEKLPATVSTRMMKLRKDFGELGLEILPFRTNQKKNK